MAWILWGVVGLFLSSTANAEIVGTGTGVGAVISRPSGVAISHKHAATAYVQGFAGWDMQSAMVNFKVDHIWTIGQPLLPPINGIALPFYAGIGGCAMTHLDGLSETIVAGRLPIGVLVSPINKPVEVYVEIAPELALIPATQTTLTGAFGVRFYPF